LQNFWVTKSNLWIFAQEISASVTFCLGKFFPIFIQGIFAYKLFACQNSLHKFRSQNVHKKFFHKIPKNSTNKHRL
jgi:hypothetical protein